MRIIDVINKCPTSGIVRFVYGGWLDIGMESIWHAIGWELRLEILLLLFMLVCIIHNNKYPNTRDKVSQ